VRGQKSLDNQEIDFFEVFFVDKRFIFFFKKDSRPGWRRLRSWSRYLLKIAV